MNKKNQVIAIGPELRKILDIVKKSFKEKNMFDIGDKHAGELIAARVIQNNIFPEIISNNPK